MELSQGDHVVISLHAPQNSEKYYHRLREDGDTFRPDCGAAMKTPVVVRLADIPTSSSALTDTYRQYGRCSRCDWTGVGFPV